MNLLPKSHEEFSQRDYWDNFFKKRGNKAFEWYGEYPELADHLHKYIKTKDDVLIVGCGNSTLGNDLYDIGYKNISNIDISPVVIRQMLNVNAKQRPLMSFQQMDALKMSFKDDQFTVVLDKGTLDALMPDDKAETVERIHQYFEEIYRVLKTGGRYICVSLLQDHILNEILGYFPSTNWMFRVVRCHEAENSANEAGENCMPVFLVVCTKFKNLPMKVLEINLGIEDKMQRLQTTDEVVQEISNVQKAAFVCSGLKRGSIADQNEVSLDLHKPGESTPRFTIYVVDIPPERKQSLYAAFIVPQGRESEWLFSTAEGRKALVKMTNHNRLVIVTLHRGQKYHNLEAVQSELSDSIKNLAPSSMSEKIPFLSLGSDVGDRVMCCEGCSEYSGSYVVEDVEVAGEKFRRLYYLKSQLVIQSEAKLRTVKSRKGKHKTVVDGCYLTCKHHIYMSLASCVACTENPFAKIAVVGLGGGGLCTFLKKFLPKISITGVDIDKEMLKVATEWFGLLEDEKLKVQICDGVDFLKSAAESREKYSAILFDVDSKDSTIGMSCPPKEFLESSVLDNVVQALDKSGLFILNVVLRDPSLRPSIMATLKGKFNTLVAYKLAEDLNEVVLCTQEEIDGKTINARLGNACQDINLFFKKNNLGEQVIDKGDFLKTLETNV